MRKVFFGAIIGAVAMYFLDPGRGGDRRRMLTGMWSQNKDTVLDAARTTAGAVSGVTQGVGGRVGDALQSSDGSSNGQPTGSTVGQEI